MKKQYKLLCLLVGVVSVTILISSASFAQRPVSLAGDWRFVLDPTDSGVKAELFKKNFYQRIVLPGVLQSQRFGNEIGTTTP